MTCTLGVQLGVLLQVASGPFTTLVVLFRYYKKYTSPGNTFVVCGKLITVGILARILPKVLLKYYLKYYFAG